MSNISTTSIRELREKTGAGMMDCKSALVESSGDISKAIDWLRTKGLLKAAKKSSRVTTEGLVCLHIQDNAGALVEINSETDFVARNDIFQSFVSQVASLAVQNRGDKEKILAASFPGTTDKTTQMYLQHVVALIGENISFRRVKYLNIKKNSTGVLCGYIHNQIGTHMGRIGVLVSLQTDIPNDNKVLEFGKKIAMHVAAMHPLAVTQDELDLDIIEHERSVLMAEAKESGKSDAVVEKMIEGRLRKFFEETILMKQKFIMDMDKTIEQVSEDFTKEFSPIKILAFRKLVLGEGIERNVVDFADEVAATKKEKANVINDRQ